jgi:hypothetical protein
LLTLRSIPFPKTHDLSELAALVPEEAELGMPASDLAALSVYAIEGPYPGDWEPIERPDAEQAVVIAHRVRAEVRIQLPAEVIR